MEMLNPIPAVLSLDVVRKCVCFSDKNQPESSMQPIDTQVRKRIFGSGVEHEAEAELKIEEKKLIVSPSNRRHATSAEAKAVADKVFTKQRRLMEKLSK